MRYNLKNLCEIKYGKDQKKVEDPKGTVPIFGTGGLMGYASEYLYNKPSVLIPRKGSISKVAFSNEPFWTVDTLFYTIINEEIVLPKYLYYVLSRIDLNRYNEGTTIPSLRTETLNRIELEIPAKEEQKQVIKIMDALQEKIEINQEIISKLESFSHLLFQQWFIDFEFPNEQGRPYKTSGGKMVESELVMIPEGWNVKSVSDISKIMSGGTPRTSVEEYWNGSIPFFTPKDVNNSYYTISTEKQVTEAGLAKCASKLYPKDTIFITARGTVGKLALSGTDMAMNQSCYALKHEKNYQYYLYLQLKKLLRSIIQSSNGAVFNAINVNDFNSYKLPYATNEVLESFEAAVTPLFNMILNLSKENDKLSKLRDTLLPKLLSGEIEVPVLEPEKI